MSDWVLVDQTELTEPRRITVNGAEVEVFASPYDVPVAVKSTIDKQRNVLVVQLRYVADDEELGAPQQVEANVRAFLGKESQRLRRIEISLPAPPSDILSQIASAISSLKSRAPGLKRRMNFDLAGKTIREAASVALPLVTW